MDPFTMGGLRLAPLQVGIPGGPELVVVFLILLLVFGVPVVLVALGVIGYRRTTDEDRLEKLETRVEHLESELERTGENAEPDGGEDRTA